MAYTSTPTHGSNSHVEKNDVVVAFSDGWELNFGAAFADKSSQGDKWESALPGQGKWGGKMSGWLALGNTEHKALHDALVAATPGTLLTDCKWLIDGSTEGWHGNCYIENVSVVTSKGDNVKLSIDFRGDGTPTLSDAQ